MFYDIANIPGWLLCAFFVGAITGWMTFSDAPRGTLFAGWTRWGLLAFAIGVMAAVLKLLPGRSGLWLELALLMSFVYVVGCFVGEWLKSVMSVDQTAAVAAPPSPPAVNIFAAHPESYPGVRPAFAAASIGVDDLTLIDGVRAIDQKALNDLGVHRLKQVADWNADHAAWVDHHLSMPGRVMREGWVASAARLAGAGGTMEAKASGGEPSTASVAGESTPATKADAGSPDAAVEVTAIAAAPTGPADDLKLIKGIGPRNETALNGLGVHRFSQIADWSDETAAGIGRCLAFPGRIERERWIPQAKFLGAGIDTLHSAGVKSGAIVIDAKSDEPLSDAEVTALAASLPATLPKVDGEEDYAGARPLGLAAARGGKPDDLKLIKGIGKQNEARLHALGVWHFDQIAAWSVENVKWIGSYLSFPGRIDREEWIRQARELAAGVKTDFARRVEAGLVKSSADDGSHGQGNITGIQPKT